MIFWVTVVHFSHCCILPLGRRPPIGLSSKSGKRRSISSMLMAHERLSLRMTGPRLIRKCLKLPKISALNRRISEAWRENSSYDSLNCIILSLDQICGAWIIVFELLLLKRRYCFGHHHAERGTMSKKGETKKEIGASLSFCDGRSQDLLLKERIHVQMD